MAREHANIQAIYKRPKPSRVTMTRTRKRVFERDNWTCQECGLRIPATAEDERSGRYAPSLNGVWLELDHVVPWRAGGLFEHENLQALCTPCNKSKSDSLVHASVEERITEAKAILNSRPANEATAVAAIRVLRGERG